MACAARHFDFLRKADTTVPPVRLRVRFACLWGFLDLCQPAEKYFFDRLQGHRKKPVALAVFRKTCTMLGFSPRGSLKGSAACFCTDRKPFRFWDMGLCLVPVFDDAAHVPCVSGQVLGIHSAAPFTSAFSKAPPVTGSIPPTWRASRVRS